MHIARIILSTAVLLCWTLAGAQAPNGDMVPPRLRIGLVLSGGGARGAAHIGVLKMLDALHVPIDAIAGTSMGAVVGGLYASGLSGAQIEQAMASVDWQSAFRDRPPRTELGFRRKEEDREYLVNLPLGLQGKKLVIPKGLVQGQKLNETLRRLTLPVALVQDFDRLPTSFRAVATNLETGDAVVIGDGDLTTAMRASMSVPGVFAPVEYRDQVLVDGGLAENLPIDVARAMGVDVLIVVDAGFPLQSRKSLDSIPSITNQMLAILLGRDAERQLQTLGPSDIVISPNLGDFSSYDFVDTLKIVNAGEAAAKALTSQLSRFAVSDADYSSYLQARGAARAGLPKVQFVRVDPESTRYKSEIQDMFGQFVGSTLDPDAVKHEVETLYGRGNIERLDYRLIQDQNAADGLDFTAQRNSWGPNYLRFGLSLQDDFKGNTIFNAAARLDFTELNSLGAESRWDMQVGSSPLLATELYLPLDNVRRYFVAPHMEVEAHDLPQVENGRQVGEFRISSFDDGIDFGRELGNWGELRVGVLDSRGNSHVSLGDFSVPASSFNLSEYFLRFGYDTLDTANFPHSGQSLTSQLSFEGNGGGEQGSNQYTIDYRAAHSWAKNTIGLWLSSGSTIGGSETNVRSFFPLGGFMNLSGVPTQTLAGPQFAIGRLIYLRKVGNGGEGILDVPAYIGMSLEDGNTWTNRSQVSFGNTRKDASIFFGADTYVGPAYFAVGYDESGSIALYIFLGRAF
jgi:NTE family protein